MSISKKMFVYIQGRQLIFEKEIYYDFVFLNFIVFWEGLEYFMLKYKNSESFTHLNIIFTSTMVIGWIVNKYSYSIHIGYEIHAF